MTRLERATLAITCLANRISWHLWRRRRNPGAMDALRIAAAVQDARMGCLFCEIPTDTWTRAEYDRHQRDTHGIVLHGRQATP